MTNGALWSPNVYAATCFRGGGGQAAWPTAASNARTKALRIAGAPAHRLKAREAAFSRRACVKSGVDARNCLGSACECSGFYRRPTRPLISH